MRQDPTPLEYCFDVGIVKLNQLSVQNTETTVFNHVLNPQTTNLLRVSRLMVLSLPLKA